MWLSWVALPGLTAGLEMLPVAQAGLVCKAVQLPESQTTALSRGTLLSWQPVREEPLPHG